MNRIFKSILNYLVKGGLVVLPLGAAIFFIVWLVAKIDSALNLSDTIWVDQAGNPIYIPGLGILTILLILLIAGVIVTNFVTEPIYNWFHRWLNRLPILNFIYSSIKDLTEAFVGDEKKFNEPVLVDINGAGLKKIGFLTQKDLSKIGLPGDVAVYFPFSYSFAGQVCIVRIEQVQVLNMSASEAMKFVVSGGVSHF
ncbi:MAG: hypothetical protein JWN56_1566 [Sphingobacteriales bacterium]|nr:hypothetical protein [Sphingobacteriales bacterium]